MSDKQYELNGSDDARSAVIAALRAQMDALSHAPSGASCVVGGTRRTAIAAPEEAQGETSGRSSDEDFASLGGEPGGMAQPAEKPAGQTSAEDDERPDAKAFNRIVMLCSYHDYSREKMRKRLKREHVDEYAAEDALDRAVECGLIDDVRYGEALCAGRMRAGKGTTGIESELWDNHIDPARIPGWPEEYEQRYGSDLDRALQLIERHPPRSKRPRDSAYRRLRGKGYSSDIASKAAGIWWSRTQAES